VTTFLVLGEILPISVIFHQHFQTLRFEPALPPP